MNNSDIKVNYLAVVAAAVAAFAASSVYYIVLSNTYLGLRGIDPGSSGMTPELWQVVSQFARNIAVAFVLAYFVGRLEIRGWKGALQLALLLWFGFEAMAIVGAVIHESYPVGLYAIHAGDALLTTTLMTLILGVWRKKMIG